MSDMYPKRIRDHEFYGGGPVKMDEWWFEEAEKPHVAAFEEAIENTMNENPPYLDANLSEERDDIKLVVVLGMGQGDGGPIWEFSLKRAIASHAWHGEIEVLDDMLRTLWRIYGYTRSIRDKMRALQGQHWTVFEDLAIELDKQFEPQPEPVPEYLKWLTAEFCKELLDRMKERH